MLSCYILTFNSERRLAEVLNSMKGVADEIVVLDSGSIDQTEEIVRQFGGHFTARVFDNFRDQRKSAVALCKHDWVLEIDSDEVLSDALRQRLLELKAAAFSIDGVTPDAFGIRRDWFLLGKPIHCFYPSRCPDWPVRLFRRSKAGYGSGAIIHEAVTGYATTHPIDEPILHYTCDSVDQMYAKVNRYTTLLAEEMHRKGIRGSALRTMLFPWLLWAKFFLGRGGWKDGRLGWVHGRYVRDVVWQKYLKLELDYASSLQTRHQPGASNN